MSLRASSPSQRAFATMVLLVLGLGYSLALVFLFTKEVKPQLEQGHGLVQGVANTYNGVPTAEPRLIVALRGAMASTVSPAEFEAIETWIADGATEEGYAGPVQSVIENTCASCHDASGYPPTVSNYEQAHALTSADSGIDVSKLARMTHIHVLGIPLLLFVLGSFFVRTRWPEWLKAVLVILPFVGVIWDIGHWWLTKLDASHASGIVIGGTLLGVGFGLQWVLSMIDVWAPLRAGAERQS